MAQRKKLLMAVRFLSKPPEALFNPHGGWKTTNRPQAISPCPQHQGLPHLLGNSEVIPVPGFLALWRTKHRFSWLRLFTAIPQHPSSRNLSLTDTYTYTHTPSSSSVNSSFSPCSSDSCYKIWEKILLSPVMTQNIGPNYKPLSIQRRPLNCECQ